MTDLGQQESSLLPVTALAVLGEYILAGAGTHLCIYSQSDSSLLSSQHTLKSQPIHGITVSDRQAHLGLILIWGGNLARFARVICDDSANTSESSKVSIQCGPLVETIDRIFDAAFSPAPPQHIDASLWTAKAGIITAHNALLQLDIETSISEQLTDIERYGSS